MQQSVEVSLFHFVDVKVVFLYKHDARRRKPPEHSPIRGRGFSPQMRVDRPSLPTRRPILITHNLRDVFAKAFSWLYPVSLYGRPASIQARVLETQPAEQKHAKCDHRRPDCARCCQTSAHQQGGICSPLSWQHASSRVRPRLTRAEVHSEPQWCILRPPSATLSAPRPTALCL